MKNKFNEVKKILWIILFANFVVAAAKIIMGTIINSVSMTADGFHSLTDGSSNVVGLIGIGIASKPIDTDHPYGHKKYETVTGLFIVAMLLFLGIKILTGAIDKFSNPIIPNISIESLVVMFVTLIINIIVTTYEKKKGVELKSTILISDSMHTRSDIFVTLGVIVGLVAIKLGAPPVVDPIVSIIVAGFILYSGYEIFKNICGVLVDEAMVEASLVEKIVLCHPEVKGVHKIRSRGTSDDIYIDMHILANSSLTLAESHELAHSIEDEINENLSGNVQVIIHLEPYNE